MELLFITKVTSTSFNFGHVLSHCKGHFPACCSSYKPACFQFIFRHFQKKTCIEHSNFPHVPAISRILQLIFPHVPGISPHFPSNFQQFPTFSQQFPTFSRMLRSPFWVAKVLVIDGHLIIPEDPCHATQGEELLVLAATVWFMASINGIYGICDI